ncbi:acetoacetate decarboxylase family protein [Paraburkholderia phymatum]|uniref:Acetoacetate decarboxylase family protein n=1 Tax=Paraburkholderia phymatum TaxID=148447 RepID=A0ACC6U4I9_9BURK
MLPYVDYRQDEYHPVNLKIIPGRGRRAPAIAQLVGYSLADIRVKGAWSGPARLGLVPHVNAPVADLPVKRVFGAVDFIADITLPYGRVLHDYMEVVPRQEAAAWCSASNGSATRGASRG